MKNCRKLFSYIIPNSLTKPKLMSVDKLT